MDTKVKETELHEHELEVTLAYDEIKNELDQAYRKESKTIQIPGFRKGKAPRHMIKKLYGEAIEYKASEEIANKKFWDVVEEKELKPISTPQLTDLDFVPGEKLAFSVKYEVKPVFDPKDYKGIEIEKPIFKTTDEMVDREVDGLIKSKAAFEEAEKVEDKTFKITVILQGLDENGEPIENNRSENMAIDLSQEGVSEEIVEKSMGKKAGDKFEFTFIDEHKHGDETHKQEFRYEAEITKVEKLVLPEITEELVEEISSKKAKTIEEFKAQIRENIEKYNESQSENIFSNTMLGKVVENNEFTVPQGYVQVLLDRMVQQEMEYAERQKQKVEESYLREQLKTRAEFSARWQIVMENIARVEELTVEDADIEKIAEKEAEKTGLPVDKLVNFYKESGRKDALLEEKVIEFLKANVKVKEIDPEDKIKEKKGKKK